LDPDFPAAAVAQVQGLAPAHLDGASVRDLRELPWCSIDNDDSRDLDQLTVAAPLDAGRARVMVAVADVSALVPRGSAVDDHASLNTTSGYTPPQNFPLLPPHPHSHLTSPVPSADPPA